MHKVIINKIGFLLIVFCLYSTQGTTQILLEAELEYKKLADNTIVITAIITDAEEYEPVENLEIEFISRVDTTIRTIGKAMTNDEGVAIKKGVPFSSLLLSNDHKFYISFKVFNNDQYVEPQKEMSLQDVDMTLRFDEIDSTKQIVITTSSWDELGNFLTVEELDVYLYVPRLFSLLPIGEIYTEEGGKGIKAFPTDLPGGKNGEIEVLAKIEDHEKFGNIEISNSINWGKPTDAESNGLPRALWSERPPTWMIVTFVILMAGVWFHYGWVILNMFKIKSSAAGDDEIIYEL